MSTPDPSSTPMALSLRDLQFAYGRRHVKRGEWVVQIPHLDLASGQQLLLTGGSGRGKSTLLHLVAGLNEPSSGTVRVDGKNMHAMKGAARDAFRGRKIGMIFQTFNLLHGFTAIENVMAALMYSRIPRGDHRQRAKSLLDELGIERPRAKPHAMSVGQQQRVAVARAMACEPVLVLADEPTASLDPENAAAAMDLIQRVCEHHGAALLCTSHDPAMTERFMNRISLDELARTPGGFTVGASMPHAPVAAAATADAADADPPPAVAVAEPRAEDEKPEIHYESEEHASFFDDDFESPDFDLDDDEEEKPDGDA